MCAQADETPYQLAVFDDPGAPLSTPARMPDVMTTDVYAVEPAAGVSELVAYSPDHDARLTGFDVEHIARLVDVWADRYRVLGALGDVRYVQVYEDRGRQAGVARVHPHGGIHGFGDIPPRVLRELDIAAEHHAREGTCVSCDVVAHERGDAVRVVAENPHFLAYVPFAARFPFEVHVTAHRHATSLLDLTDPERRALADLIRTVVRGYEQLFGDEPAYAMSMHQAPTDDGAWLHLTHLRIEFIPTALPDGAATSLGAAELGAGAYIIRTRPEDSAAQLRSALRSGVTD